MVKCPQCSAENQIGTIFCRTCGEKLDLDSLQPDDLAKGNYSATGNAAYFALRLLILAITVVLIGVLGAALFPPELPDHESFNSSDRSKHYARYQKALMRSGTFTDAEASVIVNDYMLYLDEDSKMEQLEEWFQGDGVPALILDQAIVEFPKEGYARATLVTKAYEKVSIYYSIEGRIGSNGKTVEFTPTRMSVGRLPAPDWFPPLRQLIQSQFDSATAGMPEIERARKTLRNAKVSEVGKIKIGR